MIITMTIMDRVTNTQTGIEVDIKGNYMNIFLAPEKYPR